MPDREKVTQCLETCVSGCKEGCPYEYKNFIYRVGCKVDLMRDALALLKEQEEVVRCKDCKHYMMTHCNCGGCFISDDWYCADGERR